MIKQQWLATVLLLSACSGGGTTASPGPVAPSPKTARGAVEAFMEAVADSNLSRMAQLWGTASGPASKTNQPPDWERRITVMQSYLRNESHRLLPATPASDTREDVPVELRRELCTWVVPFTVIRLGDGNWLVNQIDLTKAGNPARPCVPGGAQDTTAAPPE